jgi:hypothetical protein
MRPLQVPVVDSFHRDHVSFCSKAGRKPCCVQSRPTMRLVVKERVVEIEEHGLVSQHVHPDILTSARPHSCMSGAFFIACPVEQRKMPAGGGHSVREAQDQKR